MSFRGTTVRFDRRSDGRLIGFYASGHSGYDEEGLDIVCAAVSALTQATVNGIVNILGAPARTRMDDQRGSLECELKQEATEAQVAQAQLLFRTLQEALESIQQDYPHNVQVIFRERR